MRVAAPVLARLDGRRAIVAGAGREAAYLDLDGFVVLATRPGVPLLPNAIALDGPRLPAAGESVALDLGGAAVWDPRLRLGEGAARRGDELLRVLRGQSPLVAAVEARDPVGAAEAGRRLVGLGPGLTPEGDDVVAATAAVVAAGPWPEPEKSAWLAALLPDDLRARTTALSATLLELAAAGHAPEPVHGLLGPGWRTALEQLLRLGHTTGRAYAQATAAALRAIGSAP